MAFLRLASSVALATACVVIQGCGRSCDDFIALEESSDENKECDGGKDKECQCGVLDDWIEACSEDTGNKKHQESLETAKNAKAANQCSEALATFAQA